MGDTVQVRKPSSTEAHPFAPKAEEGISWPTMNAHPEVQESWWFVMDAILSG